MRDIILAIPKGRILNELVPLLTKVEIEPERDFFDDTGLEWAPLEKNITDLETAIIYPGMCIYESSNISLGFGTKNPYKKIGAPWMEFNVAKEMKLLNTPPVTVNKAIIAIFIP